MTTSIKPTIAVVAGFIVFIIGFYMLIKYYKGTLISPSTLSAIAFLAIGAALIWPELNKSMEEV